MNSNLVIGLALVVFSLAPLERAHAIDPLAATEGAVLLKEAAPIIMTNAKALATIPTSIAEMIHLPLGLVEIVLCPLPGVSIVQGLTDVGVGILAPFKLTMNVLALPGRLCVQ